MAAASAALLFINGGTGVGTKSQVYLEGSKVRETKSMSKLCRQFDHLGWVSGTDGGVTVKVHGGSIPKPQQLVVMSALGVRKDRVREEDMCVGSVPWFHKRVRGGHQNGEMTAKAQALRNGIELPIEIFEIVQAINVTYSRQ